MAVDKREAEQVNGTWYQHFQRCSDTLFTDKNLAGKEGKVRVTYGDFFERNLTTGAGRLLSLGIGYGSTEIPLARRGFRIIGIDNDRDVLKLAEQNARNYSNGNLRVAFGDLYGDFHLAYVEEGIQACIGFGVLEHFTREHLDELVRKQMEISPKIVFMVPVRTPRTLKAFGAEEQSEGHIDGEGIYRNFWTPEYWKHDVMAGHTIVDEIHPVALKGKKKMEFDSLVCVVSR